MADMHLMYGLARCNSVEARRPYQEKFPDRIYLCHKTFSSIHHRPKAGKAGKSIIVKQVLLFHKNVSTQEDLDQLEHVSLKKIFLMKYRNILKRVRGNWLYSLMLIIQLFRRCCMSSYCTHIMFSKSKPFAK